LARTDVRGSGKDENTSVHRSGRPRGDATSLLFGFDAVGNITGVGVGGMAGD
jgi:hypothetical protein